MGRHGGGKEGERREGEGRKRVGRQVGEGQVPGNAACLLNGCFLARREVFLGLPGVGMIDKSGVPGGNEVML